MDELWAEFVTVLLKAIIAALVPLALYYVRLWIMVRIDAATIGPRQRRCNCRRATGYCEHW